MFSEGPSFFVLFVCEERELKLSLKMETLPTTMTVRYIFPLSFSDSSLSLPPLFFRFNAVNAAIFPIQCR